MKRFSSAGIVVAAITATICALPVFAAPTRERIRIDADWRFQREVLAPLQNAVPITDWRWKTEEPGMTVQTVVGGSTADWQQVTKGEDVFHGARGFAWFQTVLPPQTGPGRTVRFTNVDDNATVYLNGQELLSHRGWNKPFSVALDSAWKNEGPNILTVRVENTAGQGGIQGDVMLGRDTARPDHGLESPDYNDHAWRAVHLPHDFVIEGTFTPTADASHGSLPGGNAWYRKQFVLPASDRGKSLWIDFDGVYRNSTVYLNGTKLGTHECGYTWFRYDISQAAHYGATNVLAVHVDAGEAEGWWYEGGGIYRHVWLNKADRLHVAPEGVYVTSDVSDIAHPSATLTLRSTVVNQFPVNRSGKVVSQILGPDGASVGIVRTETVVPAGGSVDVTQTIRVPNAKLWSIESPSLYRVVTTIERGGTPVDTQMTPFGIRTIRFDPEQGFLLNGKPVKIKGTCNHQDFAGVGVGLPDGLFDWRVKRLQAMGSNAYRTSHNEVAPELLEACDRLGMLVMDENRHLGDTEEGKAQPGTPYAHFPDLENMIRRDRNHPSIIIWSMCNEEPLQGTPEGARIFQAMKETVLKYDTTRPVSCAMNGGWGRGITDVEDLQGINYSPGAYEGFHQSHPNMPLYSSETASTVSTRGIYSWTRFETSARSSRGRGYIGDEAKGYVSAYDNNAPSWAQTAEEAWKPIMEHPWVAGGFVWTGFDYKGEPTPFGWPCVNSHFGILDLCGFPKDNFYYYQSIWEDRPMVHLLPHWNWQGKEGTAIPVWAYSNADTVELLLNGKSLGVQPMPRYGHLEWSVPYAPGTLEVRAFDASGKRVATDRVATTGAPVALRLTTDHTHLTADGEDIAVVGVEVVDATGHVVPTADNQIAFSVTGAGRIAGVGNGDPSSHEPDQASNRHAFNGLCVVLVKAGESPGTIHLTATAPGLKSTTMALRTD